MTIALIVIKRHIRMPNNCLSIERCRLVYCIRLYKATPTGKPMPSVVAQNCSPLPSAGAARRHGLRQHRRVAGYRFAVMASFCPGTGRRGACGSPSAEPPPRLREAGGIAPGRLGPFMSLGAPAGAAATGVAGISGASGASGTAAAAKGSSKNEARAMALVPQPRSHQPCRPGAEAGE